MLSDSSSIIEQYIRDLDKYSIEQLRFKCQENVFPEGKTEDGTKALAEKEWPNIRVELEEPPNATINPESKDEIIAGLEQVLEKFAYWAGCVDRANPACKVRHGSFGWLNARDWFEMVDMHSRHHLHQKAKRMPYGGVKKSGTGKEGLIRY
ncbi:hypothetical protein ACFVQB_19555 [Paenibacillus sp. NPDC057886]|uniref:hypothetical protein n=1 Tax=Paenibacillus sp. NPDC057886 TaxID=3346270 RepID=UPI00367A226C